MLKHIFHIVDNAVVKNSNQKVKLQKYGIIMTICIAAITGKNQVVMASDRMVTLQIPSIEYEQNMSKTLEVTQYCVVASAGAILNFSNVYEKLKKKLTQEKNC